VYVVEVAVADTVTLSTGLPSGSDRVATATVLLAGERAPSAPWALTLKW
jgi:hypothetical protein